MVDKTFRIEMDDRYNEFDKTIGTVRILHDVLLRDIHATKSDLFYHNVNLFQNQDASVKIINNIATWLGRSRYSLNLTASSKGVVIGNLSFMKEEISSIVTG